MSAKSVIFNLITKYDGSGAQKAFKGIDQLNKKINHSLKEGGKKAALAGGAAAGGAFVAGLTGMIQLDNSRAKLEAQLGLTKDQSKKVGSVAGTLYAHAYGESMDDVNTAITSVIQNMSGMKTASVESLNATTAAAMDVATVMGEDVGKVTASVAQMMKTGMAKNSKEAFDILVAGTQRGANKAQDLLDTFNEYSTQFRKLGLDGKLAMGLIQQGLQGGARDADIVADSLKEFSIRAVDGSKLSAQGFKDLGLNAKQMGQMIGKGGEEATVGLDMVLRNIRGIKDPVKQASVATSLFGTQWEDMGAAFLKMDPSTAEAALGKVTDATKKAGDALGGTAQARFTAFKRMLQQDVTAALGNTIAWMGKHTTTAKALGIAVLSLVAIWGTFNAVSAVMAFRLALVTEGTAAYAIKTAIVTGATKAWTAAQWLFNAAMSANPISLIIIGLVALGVAIFVAYKKSETFRNIVQATWAGIKAAFTVAWAFIKPILVGLGQFLIGNVVPIFKMLWTVIKAVWSGILTAIRVAWAIIKPIFNVIVAIIRGVLVVAFVVLKNAIKIVWIAIQIYIKVAWFAIKTYFMAIKAVIMNVLAPIFRWLWNNVIKPTWTAIKAGIAAGWAAIRVIFNAIKAHLAGPLSAAFRTFKSVVGTLWNGLKTAISTVWNSGIKPIFNALKTAVGAVRHAFSVAIDGIRAVWNKLKDIAKVPVNFVIGLYNKGIVGLVNGIAKLAGIGTRLSPLPTFAGGGVMPGYAPGKDSLLAAVSPGESIFRPEFTRAVGTGWVSNANAVARKQGTSGVRNWLSTGGAPLGGEGMAFARGGTVPGFAGHFDIGGVVGGFLKKAKSFALGPIEKAAHAVLDKLLGGAIPGSGMFHDLIAGIPKWIKEHLFGWLKDKSGGAGGPGMANALNWAKGQSGKPYVWGGVGPGGYDCSGFMSAITNVIHGKSPYSRMFSTHSFNGSSGPGGFVRNLRSGFMVGVTNAGVGHMAGTLLNTNVESNGSQGVHYGPGARGATNGLFPAQYGLKADSGALMLRPGWNPPVLNGTGRPELLMTRHPGGGGGEIHFHNHGPIGSQAELDRWMTRSLERLRRHGKLPSA